MIFAQHKLGRNLAVEDVSLCRAEQEEHGAEELV